MRASQPTLGIGKEKDLSFHLEEWVELMVMVVGTQMEMEVPMTKAIAHMAIEGQMGMETHQSMETHRGKDIPKEGEEVQMVMGDLMEMGIPQVEEEDLSEKMGIQMEEMEVLTLMIVEMGMILHPHQIPDCMKKKAKET